MITATIGKEHFKTELTANGLHAVADEAVEQGGGRQGPAPEEYLQMALAACTAITLRMYADRKHWAVEKIHVEVSSQKSADTTILKRNISIDGVLDSDQRDRLLHIANSCPVHKTLTNPIEIRTSLQ